MAQTRRRESEADYHAKRTRDHETIRPAMVLMALLPADHLLIERDRGQFVASRRRRIMANARAERLLKIPAEPSLELRIPGAAAQTRVVSMAGIRLGSWEFARAFKGIICDDISEIAVGTLITERH